MSNRLNKEIFKETGCISREKILLYKDGLLRRSDMHEVERHLVDCNLCSEALEGLAMVSGTSALDEISNRFSQKSEKQKPDIKNYLAIAATVAGIALLSYFAVDQMRSIKSGQHAHELPRIEREPIQTPAPAAPGEEPTKTNVASSNPSTSKESMNLQHPPPAGINSSKTITIDSPSEDVIDRMESKDNPAAGSVFESDAPTPSDATIAIDKTLSQKNDVGIPKQSEGLKERKSIEEKAVSGTGVDSPRIIDLSTTKAESVTNSTYSLRIENPLSLYKKGKYEEAILGFERILYQYPKDENAMFHKGMSLYHLKRYQAALDVLKPISETADHSFKQAAEFHAASCLEELGKTESALATYHKIVQGGGLYKDKAANRIKALERILR